MVPPPSPNDRRPHAVLHVGMAKCASTYLQHQAQEAAHANAQLSGDTPRYITPAGFFNAMKALDPLADRPTFIPYRERYAGP